MTAIDYTTLPLEKALEEYDTCFDDNNEIINHDKMQKLLENPNLVKYLYSEEHLEDAAKNSPNILYSAAAESFLNKCFYPNDYWEMPDYYYPSFRFEFYSYLDPLLENSKNYRLITATTTRNEAVLIESGWRRRQWDIPEYFNWNIPDLKIVFDKEKETASFVKINPETKEEKDRIEIPFGLLCGMFLKCRELGFSKPKELRPHDIKNRFPNIVEE